MAMTGGIAQLDTHDVFNQPPLLEGVNLFTGDRALSDAVASAGAGAHHARLASLGARCGSAEVIGWGAEANRVLPVLETHDRFGHRSEQVTFHPAYHELMR
ncbi:MAG: DNA alkylation response protein, partial [Sphingomonadaceae bacterium]|nr:DNA alkylation response protein [Sphingomonadaceae bacterium]